MKSKPERIFNWLILLKVVCCNKFNMQIQIIKKKDIFPSDWDGGKTYQYCIYPSGANYKDKNFDFRISSASIIKVPSDFTRFQGYRRFLVMLDNDLKISRNGQEEHYAQQEIFTFDSSDKITSASSGNDFNLMVKKNIPEVSIKILSGAVASKERFIFLFALVPASIKTGGRSQRLNSFDCMFITNEEKRQLDFQISGSAIFGCWTSL